MITSRKSDPEQTALRNHEKWVSLRLAALAFALALPLGAKAQWVTQTFDLEAGWNAIYLNIDASYATLTQLGVPVEVEGIYAWESDDSAARFVHAPTEPVASSGSPWVGWRKDGSEADLEKLLHNRAYLIEANASVTWELKGQPVPPRLVWRSSGPSLLGFPTPSVDPPSFNDFLDSARQLINPGVIQIYQYSGGEAQPVLDLTNTNVERGKAYWLNTPDLVGRFHGPFRLELQNPKGILFGETLSRYRVRLSNRTDENLKIKLRFVSSEASPVPEKTATVLPSLLIRGESQDVLSLSHAAVELLMDDVESEYSVTLGPEEDSAEEGDLPSTVDIFLGVDRPAIADLDASATDGRFAGILNIADNVGLNLIQLPVTASSSDPDGLWVGEAQINHVEQLLTEYDTNEDGSPRMVKLKRLELVPGIPTMSDLKGLVNGLTEKRSVLFIGHGDQGFHFYVTDALGNEMTKVSETEFDPVPEGFAEIQGDLLDDSLAFQSIDSLGGIAQRRAVETALEMLEGIERLNFDRESPGAYVVTGMDTTSNPVARAFRLRLMVHQSNGVDANGVKHGARFLQRVFHGMDNAGTTILTTDQDDLDPDKYDSARRISAVHLPWSSSTVSWALDGPLDFSAGNLISVVDPIQSTHDAHENNPFLHTYHPDHDNFSLLPDPLNPGQVSLSSYTDPGGESYTIKRSISLSFDPVGSDFESRTRSGDQVFGDYSETIEIEGSASEGEKITIVVQGKSPLDPANEPQGGFVLNRISSIDDLVSH